MMRYILGMILLGMAAMATMASAEEGVLCTPDDITNQYWEQLQTLEAQEGKWLKTHTGDMGRNARAEVAAKRQVPRQKLYRKMIALDKAARRMELAGDVDGACTKALEMDEILTDLVALIEFQLLTPEEQAEQR